MLDQQTVSGFKSGVYLMWEIVGNFTVRVSRVGGDNAVVNGFFLDPAMGSLPLATATPEGALRNDAISWRGFGFTVGSAPITVTDLGRYVLSGNSEDHEVRLVNASGTLVPGAKTVVKTANMIPGTFSSGALTPPVTLAANTRYYLLSYERQGGDYWRDDAGTPISLGPEAGSPLSAWCDPAAPATIYQPNAGSAYGPVNLWFKTASATPAAIKVDPPALEAASDPATGTVSIIPRAAAGVAIRYTSNGSEPSLSNGVDAAS